MKINIECRCPFCGKTHYVMASEAGFEAWQDGELIQNALPMLTPTEREQLISGICPECQDGIFGGDDDPVEDDNQNCRFQLVYEDDDGFMAEVGTDFSDEDFLELISDL